MPESLMGLSMTIPAHLIGVSLVRLDLDQLGFVRVPAWPRLIVTIRTPKGTHGSSLKDDVDAIISGAIVRQRARSCTMRVPQAALADRIASAQSLQRLYCALLKRRVFTDWNWLTWDKGLVRRPFVDRDDETLCLGSTGRDTSASCRRSRGHAHVST